MESQTNLMNNPRFIKVFPTELCHLHLSPMKCIITLQLSNIGKTPCKYGPVFALYLHDWTLYGINTVQKRVHIYMAFFLCKSFHTGLISRSFPQPKFCTIRQSNLLCISCSIRIVTYITYLNVYIILTIIEPYTPIRCVAMTV